ncbi:hypothetical protein ACFL50_05925 [Candidatus Latescibacterota bacterium]
MNELKRRFRIFLHHPVMYSIIGGIILLFLKRFWSALPSIASYLYGVLISEIVLDVWLVTTILILLLVNSVLARHRQQLLGRSATSPPFNRGYNAISLPTGFILVVQTDNALAAIQAIDQRDSLIRYVWWYQECSDQTRNFLGNNVKTGFGVAGEKEPHRPPSLCVGPLTIPWSVGGKGIGWVYFGNETKSPLNIKLALSNEVDITKIDLCNLEFHRHIPQNEWNAKLNKS